ncbi:hypothetical protein [Methylocystis sp.]|uniref:hypothetical protein n=1 Tax=Methylocystis sp. TaxID=1911079 RepID=UPI003DA5E4EA
MKLTQERKAALLTETKGLAAAFLDDLSHFRTVCSRANPSRTEIRLVSVALRRLLVDRHILNISSPRIGKTLFRAPDFSSYYKAINHRKIAFFAGARAQVFGLDIASLTLYPGSHESIEGRGDPEATVDLRLDNLLTQKVFYVHNFDEIKKDGDIKPEATSGTWASRKDVIEYVAHFGHAAHSGVPTSVTDKFLSDISNTVRYDRSPDGTILVSVNFAVKGSEWAWKPFPHSASSVDPTLFELLGTASLVASSPDIIRLESVISDEFGL